MATKTTSAEVTETIDELDARIAFFVKLLKKTGPGAVTACKRVLREIQPVGWDRATEITTRRIAEQRVSAEGQDGLHAFLEKRKPAWEVD